MAVVNQNYGKLKDSYLFAEIAKRVNRYASEHPDRHLLRLGIGDVTQPLTPSAVKALKEAAEAQGAAETFRGYMPECGDRKLREAAAAYYARRNVTLKPEEVFISSGASDELGDIVHLFDRSLPVILIEPAYPAYADVSVMDGRMIIPVSASKENGFTPEPPKTDHTALIYICSPNNPTGAVFSAELLKRWVDYAERTGSVILFDAAYEAFVQEESVPHSIYEIPGAEQCAIEICSLSKTAGFTGTRCGYTVIPLDLKRDSMSLNAMWVRNRTTRTNGVSCILQSGAAAVFTEEGRAETEQLLAVYRKNANEFMRALDQAGLWYTGGKNSPYLWVRCPEGYTSWEYFDLLLEQAGIIATPGAGFGEHGEGYIRFSMFAAPEDAAEAGRRIAEMKI